LGINGLGPRLGENIQLALTRQADLGLSGDQVASLQALQTDVLENVEPMAMRVDRLRADIVSGEADPYQATVALQELLAEYQLVADPYRAEIASILTTSQHADLQQMMWATGGGRRPGLGRGSFGRGAGLAGGTGAGLGVGLGAGRGVGFVGVHGLGRGAAQPLGRGLGRGNARGPGGRIIWR
jgi:hypothetical protein